MTIVLADAAPSGAGLAVIGVILLAAFLVGLAALFFGVRFVLRRVRN
ncbi:MAG TPA: hypothetical protein VGX28_09030 [Frankiaceae bacterium]|jgi:hypothetical protein|nr:hypothetical protein [Frankiaceae bacterium]